MADEQVLPSLIETAEKHRRIRTQGLDADMNWLALQPSELVLWSDGLRQIVSVRGDIYKEECTDILVLLTLLNKHDFLQHKCNTVFRFIKERCEHESGPETFFRRKDDKKFVYYKPIEVEDGRRINGKNARRIYAEMMDALSGIDVSTISVLGIPTWGHSEYDCFDSIRKWLLSHPKATATNVRLIDLHGWYHVLCSSFSRQRPKYNPYDNTEMFPVWKMSGRRFI